MNADNVNTGIGVLIYDVLWNVLQLSDYIDIMSARFVDKRSYELTTRIDLWTKLLSRDFIFLTDFDLRQANSNPEKGYNIIRKYIFRYVLNIQQIFKNEVLNISECLVSHLETILIPNGQRVELHNASYLIDELGLQNQDIVHIQNELKTVHENKRTELKIEQNTLQTVFKSFKNKNLGERWSKNMNSYNISITSRRPTVTQQSIYNSLIEWREENVNGYISHEIAELIMADIFDTLNISGRFGLSVILNDFVNDLNYGIQLHILYNFNRPTVNRLAVSFEQKETDKSDITQGAWWNKSSSESSITTSEEELSD